MLNRRPIPPCPEKNCQRLVLHQAKAVVNVISDLESTSHWSRMRFESYHGETWGATKGVGLRVGREV